MPVLVDIFMCRTDNYGYLVHDVETRKTAAIDAPDAGAIKSALNHRGWTLTDVFITHHGLGSTHEAVACGVPMLSLPFFWDQPALAKRTQELGLALPLIDGVMPGNTLPPAAVRDGLDRLAAERAAILDRLHTARQWEARTIASRPEIARQILAIAR